VVELGFPFSDPIADGPVIQLAGLRAMPHFNGLPPFLELVRKIGDASPIPLVLMTHYNPIFRYGEEAFANDAAQAGLAGVILPDLPTMEAGEWPQRCKAAGIAPVMLEAPNSDDDAARAIAEMSAGFIYMLSLKGVTGSDQGMGENLNARVERLRSLTDIPLTVGFGISTPEQAKTMGALCDGVAVGTGLVRRIGEAASHAEAEKAAVEYVRSLRAGLDG